MKGALFRTLEILLNAAILVIVVELFILPLGTYVMLYHRPQMGKFLLVALLPGLFQLWYNSAYLGDPFFQPYGISFWSTPCLEGLGGILFSPGRGLFVYSPILLILQRDFGALTELGDPSRPL
jgi:hypothetical protein